jgi:hypothetical protein
MNILYQKELIFKFKGRRTYVQGADIFDKVLEIVHNFFGTYPNLIRASFYNLLQHEALFSIYDETKPINKESCCALFSLYIGQSKYQVEVTATENKILSSKQYNEDAVLTGVNIKNKVASMIVKQSYSYMEQIVAMTKQLHFIVYQEAKGKWLFSKLELKDVIDPLLYLNQKLLIKAKKNFHYKLTQNAIYLDTKYLGDIWYSLID